jgi:hypothetical protein
MTPDLLTCGRIASLGNPATSLPGILPALSSSPKKSVKAKNMQGSPIKERTKFKRN